MAKRNVAAEEKAEDAILMGGSLDRDTEIARQTDEVRAAIESGDVVARMNEVNRKVDGKPYRKEYLQLVPTTLRGALALAGGVETTWKSETDKDGKDISDFDGACLVKDFFYGNDLGTKSKESQRLAVLVEGPDKAKQAAARNLAKAFNISEAEAMAKIEAMA